MNKIFIVIISLSFILISCIKGHNPHNAWSVDESKTKMIFSHAYQPQFIKINDSIDFYIKSAWCEKTFYKGDLDELGKFKKSLVEIRNYHIVLIVDENLKEKYPGFGNYWNFNDITFFAGQKQNYLISYARDLVSKRPLADTLEVKLNYSTPPDKPNEYWKTRELGSFFLYKSK
ncbi:MAG: hypothetical protein P1P88_10470 [Bacteroidales bacterium]|nr:hypothetical protein [Bacteroidales bacterium]